MIRQTFFIVCAVCSMTIAGNACEMHGKHAELTTAATETVTAPAAEPVALQSVPAPEYEPVAVSKPVAGMGGCKRGMTEETVVLTD